MTQEEFFNRYSYSVSRDRIGGGGFGTVYKAKDNLLHRTVAIKVSEVKATSDGQKTFSLKDEFEALAHVPKHPNIANYEEFYSFESPQGIFDYAVMQFYPDGNLSNAIKEGLTDQQKEDVAIQMLEGVGFLHQHKVVHRDLKPGNILIVRDGDKVIPLITDFGLSKAADTGDGSVFSNSFGGGTPRYSSPEQLQGQPLRFNTDLWSFGAILYELFTGEQLFRAGSGVVNTAQADLDIYNKIVNGDVSGLNKMPEIWRKVVERCLVVDPENRAKSTEELLSLAKGGDARTEVYNTDVARADVARTEVDNIEVDNTSIEATAPKTMTTGSSTGTGIDNPKPKRTALWVGLGLGLAALVIAMVLLLKPKTDDADTRAYQACQTVDDYRAYMRDYGQKAVHFADAKQKVDEFVADSTAKAQQAGTLDQSRQQPETDAAANTEALLKSDGSVFGHDYVDLGLPSGTLWATCNVGASKPEGGGNHYAWGETRTKVTYDWATYAYSKGEYNTLTKYCNKSDYGYNGVTDNLTTMQVGDDPASTWGSGWRMPSKEQWNELLKNTTHKWTKRNGVKGELFTAKNGHMLFLPAAGNYWDNEPNDVGVYGYYWSRSLDEKWPSYAYFLRFSSDGCNMQTNDRYNCYAVRPVCKK